MHEWGSIFMTKKPACRVPYKCMYRHTRRNLYVAAEMGSARIDVILVWDLHCMESHV